MEDASGLATELPLYAVYEYEYVSVFVSVSVRVCCGRRSYEVRYVYCTLIPVKITVRDVVR